MERRLTCHECGPYGVAGMVPVDEHGVTAYRPCSTCNPVRHAVWKRYGQSPMLASTKYRGEAVHHDEHGYPDGWHGPKNVHPPLASERGFPREATAEQLALLIEPPHEVGAAVEVAKLAMLDPPGSPERLARVEEIEKLADLMEQRMRRKAGRGSP